MPSSRTTAAPRMRRRSTASRPPTCRSTARPGCAWISPTTTTSRKWSSGRLGQPVASGSSSPRTSTRRTSRWPSPRSAEAPDRGAPGAACAACSAGCPGARARVAGMTWTARHRAWQERRVRPALEPAPERRTRFSTISDVEVERLSGPWRWGTGRDGEPAGPGGPTAVDHLGEPLSPGRWDGFDPLRDVGLAGEPPFTRGIHPTAYRSRLWTMRMFAGFGAAEDTNARFRQLLAAGQTGLSIAFDMPTLYGYDTDDPEAEGEFGTCGVAVSSLADMEVLLADLPLERISTSMTINSPAAPIWAMYIAAAEKRGVPRAALEGTTQNDILKEFVAQKELLFPPDPSMRLVTDTIEFGTKELPRWNTISISGYHIREAGSTAIQELAFTIADGMAYVEA